MGQIFRNCAISNTPILSDQKARVFFLVLNVYDLNHIKNKKLKPSFSGFKTSPTDTYKIIGYPLLATYCDNNMYTFDNPNMENLVLNILNDACKENKLEDMLQVQHMMKDGDLIIDSDFGDAPVIEMSIHEDIYQKLILKDGVKKYFGDKLVSFSDEVNNRIKDYIVDESGFTKIQHQELDNMKMFYQKKLGHPDSKGVVYTEEIVHKNIESFKSLLNNGLWDLKDDYKYLTLTCPTIDIREQPFQKEIIEAWVGAERTNQWLTNHHMEFRSTTCICFDHANQKESIKRLTDIRNIVDDLFLNSNDDEHISLESKRTLTITKRELKSKFNMWFGNNDANYEELKTILHDLKDETSFHIGDGSIFDKFSKKHELFYDYDDGTCILFDF